MKKVFEILTMMLTVKMMVMMMMLRLVMMRRMMKMMNTRPAVREIPGYVAVCHPGG